jgi:uncharacterized membrane protein YccC
VVREVFVLDLTKLNLRNAITGTIALGITIVLLGILGTVAMAAGLAAIFVIAGGPSDSKRPDLSSLLLVVGGALLTFVVSLSAAATIAATIVISLITLGATLLALWGKRYATMGVFGLLWAVLALTLGTTPELAASMAFAFALGGGVALVAMWIASLIPANDMPAQTGETADEQSDPPVSEGPATNAIFKFAIVRAIAAGACVFIGYELFPEHPAWAALTFVLVVRPPAHQTAVAGVARTIGTLLGVVVAVLITQIDPGNIAIQVAAFTISGFLMIATNKVNYLISTMFTTTLIVLSQELLQEQVDVAAWNRILATLIGVAVAFLAILTLKVLSGGIHKPSRKGSLGRF